MGGTCKTHETNFVVKNVNGDVSLDELILLKQFSKKLDVKMSTEFSCFRIGSSDGLHPNTCMSNSLLTTTPPKCATWQFKNMHADVSHEPNNKGSL